MILPKRSLRLGSLVGLLYASAACGPADTLTLDDAVARVSADRLRSHVGALSHDSMRGRDTDDVGFELARDYVVGEFARIGLQPIDGDLYLQPFDLLQAEADQGSRVTVGSLRFDYPEVTARPDWLGDRASITADGVFVGHDLVTGGIEAVGDELRGKIAFVLAGVPDGRADEPEIAARERAEVELAHRAGAVDVVLLNPSMPAAAWAARARSRRPSRVIMDGTTPYPRPAATLGPAASNEVLARLVGRSVGTVTVAPQHEVRRIRSWNVGGVLPGADEDRQGETVLFTAHLDHVGIGRPDASGDSVYNGAHDNALGVAKLIETAEALVGSGLPRSVMFLATGAEESGLLGAWHYVNEPVVPLSETVAVINHDGGLADGDKTDDVFAWGPEFSTLEGDVAWAANETGMLLNPNKSAPFAPSAGLLYRSDHYPFLISGVPVAYLMPGFSVGGDAERGRDAWTEYLGSTHHVQADNFDPAASYDSPVALTALSLRLAWRLASADAMPQTHADAPMRRSRGAPDGFFSGIAVPPAGSN